MTRNLALLLLGILAAPLCAATVETNEAVLTNTGLAVSTSAVIELDKLDTLSIQASFTDATPAAVAISSWAISGSTAAKTTHGLFTGVRGLLSTTGTLPTGLTAPTTYYVIVQSANVFGFANSSTGAVAGAYVTWTSSGSGTHTFTPKALGGNWMTLEASNDSSNWYTVANSSTAATSSTNMLWELTAPTYKYARWVFNYISGALNMTVRIYGKRQKAF